MESFKNRLKELRDEAGISMQKLAESVGASNAAVCKWENGLAEPKVCYIIKLADFFNCTTDYLLGRTDDLGTVITPESSTALTLSQKEYRMVTEYRRIDSEFKSIIDTTINAGSIMSKKQ